MIHDDFSTFGAPPSGESSSDLRFNRLSSRALSIGVRVKMTSSETMIANDMVNATLLKNRPGMLLHEADRQEDDHQ